MGYWFIRHIAPQVGDIVRVRKPLADPQMDLMYGGCFGVVMERDRTFAYVDSDEFTRRTGQLQAVSFRRNFQITDLETAFEEA